MNRTDITETTNTRTQLCLCRNWNKATKWGGLQHYLQTFKEINCWSFNIDNRIKPSSINIIPVPCKFSVNRNASRNMGIWPDRLKSSPVRSWGSLTDRDELPFSQPGQPAVQYSALTISKGNRIQRYSIIYDSARIYTEPCQPQLDYVDVLIS